MIYQPGSIEAQRAVVSGAEAQQKPKYMAALKQTRWDMGRRGMLGSGPDSVAESGLKAQSVGDINKVATNQAMSAADLEERRRLESQGAAWQRAMLENQYAAQMDSRMKARKAAEDMQKAQSEAGIWSSLLGGGGQVAGQLVGSALSKPRQQAQQPAYGMGPVNDASRYPSGQMGPTPASDPYQY